MAAAGTSMELKGGRELEAKLRELPAEVALRTGRLAVRKGAEVVRHAAQVNAVSMVGGETGEAIAEAIAVQTLRNRRGLPVAARLGIDKKTNDRFVVVSADGRRNYIPSAIEYGHDNAAAVPFMRNAWDSTKDIALQVLLSTLWDGLRREARKKARARQ